MIPHKCPHPYHQKRARRRVEQSTVFGVVLGLLLFFVAGRLSLKNVDDYEQESALLKASVEQLRQENKRLVKQQDFVHNAQKIDLQARQESRRLFTKLHDELSDIKEQLAFYQRVVAPEVLVKGLYVNSLKIKALSTTGRYRYQLVLAQGTSQKRVLKGRYALTVVGALNGEHQALKLSTLTLKSKTSSKFSFRYYQLLSDEFQLPRGFVAERLKLSIVPSAKGAKNIQQDELWRKLLTNH